MEEIWKPIKDFEELYSISNLGNIKSLPRYIKCGNRYNDNISKKYYDGAIFKGSLTNKGQYLRLVMWKYGKVYRRSVHRLVAEHFLINPENKRCVNHKNGIKTDNRVDNLEWNTHLENRRHAINILGFSINGEKNSAAKLTENQVTEIKLLNYYQCPTQKDLARKYNVQQSTISSILRGNSWSINK